MSAIDRCMPHGQSPRVPLRRYEWELPELIRIASRQIAVIVKNRDNSSKDRTVSDVKGTSPVSCVGIVRILVLIETTADLIRDSLL